MPSAIFRTLINFGRYADWWPKGTVTKQPGRRGTAVPGSTLEFTIGGEVLAFTLEGAQSSKGISLSILSGNYRGRARWVIGEQRGIRKIQFEAYFDPFLESQELVAEFKQTYDAAVAGALTGLKRMLT